MSDNYSQRVLSEYKKRTELGLLSSGLMHPTPGGLRDECVRVYIEKNKPLEDLALRSFFGPLNNEPDYVKKIEKFEIDLFRPLVGFLRGNVKNPNRRNIELLEWLMGVEVVQPPKPPPFLNIFLITIIILLLEAGAIFLWRNYTDRISVPTADEGCMYWAGTHYEPIKCEDVKGDLPVIHLDVKKLNNLKKIYLSDTLTQKSLGKVWYYGYGKQKHEFFTDSGMHPVDTVKRLKKLTPGILLKYVSYHRFTLNVIAVVCCSILGAILFAFGVDYLIRKQKNKQPVKTD